MQERKWRTGTKYPGLVPVTWKVPLAFQLALRGYVASVQQRTGKRVSMSAVVVTLAMSDRELSRLYQKYLELMPAEAAKAKPLQ